MRTTFTVALIAITTKSTVRTHSATPPDTRTNLAYLKSAIASSRFHCPGGSYEDDNEITDGLTLPTNDYTDSCPARRFRHALTTGARSVVINLGSAKIVRSIYLAVPEDPGGSHLNNLGIYLGNLGNWQDTRCWLGVDTEPKIS